MRREATDDPALVEFLRWALPRVGMRWEGFRKVRRQVGRRLRARLGELGLDGYASYADLLAREPPEWAFVDRACRITISRFFRGRRVFDRLRDAVLPELSAAVSGRTLRVWSAGAASGEEPYSIALIWVIELSDRFPGTALEVVGTEISPHMVSRARLGEFEPASLKDLPAGWVELGFRPVAGGFALRPEVARHVRFEVEDLRVARPHGSFDLVLCRHLAFTYFDEATQRAVAQRLYEATAPGGAVVVGGKERLPEGIQIQPWYQREGIYRRVRTD